jgi:hypothetical protein
MRSPISIREGGAQDDATARDRTAYRCLRKRGGAPTGCRQISPALSPPRHQPCVPPARGQSQPPGTQGTDSDRPAPAGLRATPASTCTSSRTAADASRSQIRCGSAGNAHSSQPPVQRADSWRSRMSYRTSGQEIMPRLASHPEAPPRDNLRTPRISTANDPGIAFGVACAQRPLRSAEAQRGRSPEHIWKTLLHRASPVQFAVFQLFRA